MIMDIDCVDGDDFVWTHLTSGLYMGQQFLSPGLWEYARNHVNVVYVQGNSGIKKFRNITTNGEDRNGEIVFVDDDKKTYVVFKRQP